MINIPSVEDDSKSPSLEASSTNFLTCDNCNKRIELRKKDKRIKFCSKACRIKARNKRAVKEQQASKIKDGISSKYIKGIKLKLKLIEETGGCSRCGYHKNLAALEFHHINPTTKSIILKTGSLTNRKKELVLEEIKKCILLCANCHREMHHSDLEIINLQKFK